LPYINLDTGLGLLSTVPMALVWC